MAPPADDHGVENEPHVQGGQFEPDPTEIDADKLLEREWNRSQLADHVEHNVWEEPTLSTDLAGQPGPDQLTYQRWLNAELEQTSREKTWLVTLLVVAAAGPWGILGAIFSGMTGAGGFGSLDGISNIVGAVVIGPITEEITKIALALWIVEKRPHWFSSIPQILLCAAAGGLAFAAIENLVYFHIYVPRHTQAFEAFRWTACVGLHVSCSLVAGLGLARIWDNAIRNRTRPKIALGVPWFVLAMTGHGLYNFAVTMASLLGWLDFLQPAGGQ